MRACSSVCVALAISLTGCASWHQPSLVFRGRPKEIRPNAVQLQPPVNDDEPESEDRVSEDSASDEAVNGEVATVVEVLGSSFLSEEPETLTPPIEGTAHRSRRLSRSRPFRTPAQQASEKRARESLPVNPIPDQGYVELPPPPDLD